MLLHVEDDDDVDEGNVLLRILPWRLASGIAAEMRIGARASSPGPLRHIIPYSSDREISRSHSHSRSRSRPRSPKRVNVGFRRFSILTTVQAADDLQRNPGNERRSGADFGWSSGRRAPSDADITSTDVIRGETTAGRDGEGTGGERNTRPAEHRATEDVTPTRGRDGETVRFSRFPPRVLVLVRVPIRVRVPSFLSASVLVSIFQYSTPTSSQPPLSTEGTFHGRAAAREGSALPAAHRPLTIEVLKY